MILLIMWYVWWDDSLELVEKDGKIQKVSVQDVKVTYLVDELISYLPDKLFLDLKQGHIWN